jgi:isopentenyl-diphosphate delta-isomerase
MGKIHFFLIVSLTLQASVEHKDEFIDTYLSNISNSMDEKTQLLEHIQKNPDGRFIDIGTGGDSIVIIAKQLPKNSRPTLIAADMDPLVLESIKTRRPEIHTFLNNSSGPKIELMTMTATEMDKLSDSSLSGIGASALAHEIYSYTPNKSALDQFVSETCRVLEKNGMLIYRDPKWVNDPETRCIMTIRSEIGKYYATLFLTKFLDRKYSLIRDYREECCKPLIYSPNDVKVTAFLKTAHINVQMTFSEFLNVLCSDIDYTKSFSIEAPKGLLAEIQRHYLMYLRDYFAVALLDSSLLTQSLNCAMLNHEQISAIKSFAQRKGIPITDDQLDAKQFPLFFQELETLRKIFSKGYTMTTKDHPETRSIANILLGKGLDRNLFHFADDQILVIDPKMLTLLFHGKQKGIFQRLEPKTLPLDLLEHLKLEGEEHYFYKTTDELITYMGQYSQFILKNSPKTGYCLAPIDSQHVKEAQRLLYRSILERDTLIIDLHGNVQPPVTEKNIIHFQLQPERKAFATYKKILQETPDKYPSLKRWLSMGNHELLDLVSHNDVVIGVMSRTEIYEKHLNNFRVINAFVINSKGELWIPTRHASKNLFPLALDCSVGGHVLSNELYFDAFCRESLEEINLDPRNYPHKLLSKLTPQTDGTSALMEIYEITYDGTIQVNPDDIAEGQWISPKELKEMLKTGVLAKTDLKIILEACFPDA